MSSFVKLNCASMKIKTGKWIVQDHFHSNDLKMSRFLSIIGSNKYTFSNNLCHKDVNNLFLSQILTVQEAPVFCKSDLSNDQNYLLLNKVNELMDCGILRVSFSDYSSYVSPQYVNDKLELFVDYTNLNLITIKRNYIIPSIQPLIRSITESNLFSKIIIKDAYHQLPLTEDSKPKTAFLTDFGLFEFNVMHKNMKNADDFLQMLMDFVLDDKDLRRNVKVRLDQILIHTNNFDHHLDLIRNILNNLRNANLKIDLDKSLFLMNHIKYLGWVISPLGISIDRDEVFEIANFLIPQNKADIRIFLDLTSKYKNFIMNYDQLVQPIASLLNSVQFTWHSQEQTAFDNIKCSIISIPPFPFADSKKNEFYN